METEPKSKVETIESAMLSETIVRTRKGENVVTRFTFTVSDELTPGFESKLVTLAKYPVKITITGLEIVKKQPAGAELTAAAAGNAPPVVECPHPVGERKAQEHATGRWSCTRCGKYLMDDSEDGSTTPVEVSPPMVQNPVAAAPGETIPQCPDHPDARAHATDTAGRWACGRCGQVLPAKPDPEYVPASERRAPPEPGDMVDTDLRCPAHPDAIPTRYGRGKVWRCARCQKDIAKEIARQAAKAAESSVPDPVGAPA